MLPVCVDTDDRYIASAVTSVSVCGYSDDRYIASVVSVYGQ